MNILTTNLPVSIDINDTGVEFPIIAYNEDVCTRPHDSLLIVSGNLVIKENPFKNDGETK